MERAEILKRVTTVVARICGLDESQVSPTSKFVADLDCDDIDLIEIEMDVEDQFEGIDLSGVFDGFPRFDSKNYQECVTIDNLVDLVATKLSK